MSGARMAQRRDTERRRRELFEAAAEIVRFEYGGQLTLDGVARRLYASPRQVQRAFSEAGQTGFRDYLTHVRMESSRELLCESSYCVREIARAVGYHEPAQFAKAFRRAYGVSPSELRGRLSAGGLRVLEPMDGHPVMCGTASRRGQTRLREGSNGQLGSRL